MMDEETTQHIIITVSRMWQSLYAVQASSSFPLPLCLTMFSLGNILLCVCVFSVCVFCVPKGEWIRCYYQVHYEQERERSDSTRTNLSSVSV